MVGYGLILSLDVLSSEWLLKPSAAGVTPFHSIGRNTPSHACRYISI